MTLDQFLKDNRAEVIRRTRAKVASRSSPAPNAEELEHGVPLFLSQLSTALQHQGGGGTAQSTQATAVARPAIDESAARHGRDLQKFGFTIEQVVRDYGDVCQAITELAEERDATLSISEFHTLNRCLDDAIAGAVSSWNEEDLKRAEKVADTFTRDLRKLVEQAKTAVEVIRLGRVGAGGATGALLLRALTEMSTLITKAETR